MRRNIILLITFILIVLGILGYLYFFQEKISQSSNKELVNVSISAIREGFPDKNIIINYNIKNINNTFFRSGKTLSQGALLEKILSNDTYVAIGYPETQELYSSRIEFDTFSRENRHLRFSLIKPGDIEIDSEGVLGLNKNLTINLNLKNGELYQKPFFCFEWGFHILEVDIINNFTEITKIKDYDKCYDLDKSLTNNNKNININFNYTTWTNLNEDDFIKFILIDRDYREDYIYEIEGIDVGGENYEVTFS